MQNKDNSHIYTGIEGLGDSLNRDPPSLVSSTRLCLFTLVKSTKNSYISKFMMLLMYTLADKKSIVFFFSSKVSYKSTPG